MTPRRRETKIATNQPVRFYKMIALSFLAVTIILLGFVVFMSTKRASITINTKESPVDVSLSVSIGKSMEAQQVTGLVATTTLSASQKFSPSGTEQEPGIATGVITIHNESGTAQPLVATTRFLSLENILFRLKDTVNVPAEGTIEAEVYADVEGASGNIEPTKFTIPGLNETRQQVIFGTSDATMTGGLKTIGVLGEEDIKNAKNILLEKVKANAEKEFRAETADLTPIYSILESEFDVDTELGTEVSEFTMSVNAKVLGVFYNNDEVKKVAENNLTGRAVDDSEIIKLAEAEPTVILESYDSDTEKAVLTVFHSGVASFNPESKQIDKKVFFGQTKDEVRRYVLSLDHVQSVDIDFSPGWIGKVPQVAEYVSVVVKSVR